MTPPKTNTKGKSKKQRKDNQSKEEMSKAQPNNPEGKTKETVEEKSPAVLDGPSESEKTKDEPIKTEGATEETVEEKSSSVLDGPSTPENTEDELWEECEELQEELESDQNQKRHFKIVRNKVQRSWDNVRRNIAETKARMKRALRTKQNAEKCHIAETQKYEEKLRHLTTAYHNEIIELKMAALAKASETHAEYLESEITLQKTIHDIKAEKWEEASSTKTCVTDLKQRHQDELWALEKRYRQWNTEIEARYLEKLKAIADENSDRLNKERDAWDEDFLTESEEKQEDDQPQKLDDMQKNWRVQMNRMVNLLPRVEALRDRTKQLSKRLITANLKGRRWAELRKEMEAKACESRPKMLALSTAMAKSLKRDKKMSAHILCERRELYLEHQHLELKYEQAQREYDKQLQKRTMVSLNMQQKDSLDEMILEKKIQAMAETLEKMQMKLWVVLTFMHGEQRAAKNFKDLVESKDVTINTLKDELSQKLKEYEDLRMEATAFDIHAEDKRLPVGDIKKKPRKGPENDACENLSDLVLSLMPSCTSEK